jgi:peptide-methionine (S)-S-oxide reductase
MKNFFLIFAASLATIAGCNNSVAQDPSKGSFDIPKTQVQKQQKSGQATKSQYTTGKQKTAKAEAAKDENKMEIATFGAGCFWCVEAVFQQLDGVESVMPGYMGGQVENPTYKQVCTGTTGHAEVIQIKFDPNVISFSELLYVFWKTHDPTTLNRQGADVGTQYRSAVFYHNDEQKAAAEEIKKKLNDENHFGLPVVTEISAASKMYEAEDYHQNYFNENPGNPYCRNVIPPKLDKLKKYFGDKLKSQFK